MPPQDNPGRQAGADTTTTPPPLDTARILGHVEEALPDSKWTRAGIVLKEGGQGFIPGMANAIVDDFEHPWRTAGMLGGSAALGAAAKILLPERGPAALIGIGALTAYFVGTTAYDAYQTMNKGLNAKNRQELDAAGQEMGDLSGSLVINGALSGGAFGLGRWGGGKVLLSERMDGFADAKARFWGTADNPLRLKGNLASDGVSRAGTVGVASRLQVEGDTAKLLFSDRQAPQGLLRGELDPNASMDISVYLKSKATDLRMERYIARMSQGQAAPLSAAEYAARFGADQSSLDKLTAFARDNSLTVKSADLASGRVELTGSTGDMQKAFGVKLSRYEHPSGVSFRGRQGMISVPTELAHQLDGVYGLDDRVQAHSRIARLTDADIAASALPEGVGDEAAGGGKGKGTRPRKTVSYNPNEVADIYQFPQGTTGKGVTVAIPELGGGFDPQDNAVYFKNIGIKNPNVEVVTIDGAKNIPDGANGASGEVHLDSQVVGAVAPDATQRLVFSANSDRGFIDSINRSTFHQQGETPASSISISWGGPEDTWTDQGLRGMNQEFKKAVVQGKRIYAAAGDDGALDNSPSKTYQVDFPSSSIWVTGMGGTSLIGNPATATITSETVWNRGRGAGGGGISEKFPVPDYQKGLKLPPSANRGAGPGRGVPDFSYNSDPGTGYNMRAGGEDMVTGGTSAAAPLAAALDARVTEALGAGKQIPTPLNNFLYETARTRPGVFNDVVKGDNKGYPAGVGWDAASGLGSINGTAFLDAIRNRGTGSNFSRFLSSSQPVFSSAGADQTNGT